jgi:hypothetical protein
VLALSCEAKSFYSFFWLTHDNNVFTNLLYMLADQLYYHSNFVILMFFVFILYAHLVICFNKSVLLPIKKKKKNK